MSKLVTVANVNEFLDKACGLLSQRFSKNTDVACGRISGTFCINPIIGGIKPNAGVRANFWYPYSFDREAYEERDFISDCMAPEGRIAKLRSLEFVKLGIIALNVSSFDFMVWQEGNLNGLVTYFFTSTKIPEKFRTPRQLEDN